MLIPIASPACVVDDSTRAMLSLVEPADRQHVWRALHEVRKEGRKRVLAIWLVLSRASYKRGTQAVYRCHDDLSAADRKRYPPYWLIDQPSGKKWAEAETLRGAKMLAIAARTGRTLSRAYLPRAGHAVRRLRRIVAARVKMKT